MIVKKKERNSKKMCFTTPEELFLRYKSLKKIANENGLDIEINSELKKSFQKLIIRAEKDLEKIIKKEKNNEPKSENSDPDNEPEM